MNEWAITSSNMSMGWGTFLLWQSWQGHDNAIESDGPITTLTITIANPMLPTEPVGFWELLHYADNSGRIRYKGRHEMGYLNWEFCW